MNDLKVYVIHVRGQKEREEHIKTHLKKFNIDFEFILDGNKEDITPEHLDKYFADNYKEIAAGQSCTLKHIYACEELLKSGSEYGLIFEDDILLSSNFNEVLSKIMIEIREKNLSNFIISLEKSNHAYVHKQELVKDEILYKKKVGRCAGAYLVDIEFVNSLINDIETNKCHRIIDWYHNDLSENDLINIYWSHPTIAEQASHNGKMPSLIDNKKLGWFRRLIYFLQGKIKKRWSPVQN